MAGRNNTTSFSGPIGDGQVGLSSDVTSTAGQRIQQMASEFNLNVALNEKDKSLTGLVEATIRMVDRWLPGDKIRILKEFGSTNNVNPRDTDSLNRAVAIALISSLPRNELRSIIGRKNMDETKATKEMNAANARAATNALHLSKQYLNTLKLQERYSSGGGDEAGSTNTLLHNIGSAAGNKKGNISKPGKYGTFKLEDITAKTTIPALKKEITAVLSKAYMSDADITMMASRLNITYNDGISRRELSKKITNLVLHYTASILGENKGMYASRFDPKTVEAIKDILILTASHGWLAGKPGMDAKGFALLRKKALEARREQQNNIKKMKDADKVSKKKKLDTSFFDADGNYHLIGINTTDKTKIKSDKATWRVIGRLIDRGKNNTAIENKIKDIEKILGIKSDDEQSTKLSKISQICKEFAINTSGRTYTDVIYDVAAKIVSEENSNKKQLNNILKIKDPKKREAMLSQFKRTVTKSSGATVAKAAMGKLEDSKFEQDYSDKIPVISLKNGEPTSYAVKAVPVWVVGQGAIDNAEVEKNKKKLTAEANQAGETAFENMSGLDDLLKKRFKRNLRARDGFLRNLTGKNDLLAVDSSDLGALNKKTDSTSYQAGKAQNTLGKPIKVTGIPASQNITTNITNATASNDKATILTADGRKTKSGEGQMKKAMVENGITLQNPSITASKSTFSLSDEAQAKWDSIAKSPIASARKAAYGNIDESLKDKKALKVSAYTDHVSGFGAEVFKNRTMSKVIPVLDLNKSHDYTEEIKDLNIDILATVSSLRSTVAELPSLFMGLQMGGTAVNVEAAAAAKSIVASNIKETAAVVGKYMASATGSTMRAANPVSKVMTGDARRGTGNKANPELVSVDWNAKKIDVTPVPAFATGGSAKRANDNSNVKNVQRMTTNERNNPLSVGISSGLVNYTKRLDDVTDDGSNTAIKVYSINSSINDKIKIGNTEISLFEAVYGTFASVSAIEQTLNTNTQVLNIIASNTASISTSTNAIANKSDSSSGFQFPTNLNSVLAGN